MNLESMENKTVWTLIFFVKSGSVWMFFKWNFSCAPMFFLLYAGKTFFVWISSFFHLDEKRKKSIYNYNCGWTLPVTELASIIKVKLLKKNN